MTTNSKAFAWMPVLVVIAGAALIAPRFEVPAFLQRKPPTKELSSAEIAVRDAQAKQAAAEAALAKAMADEHAKQVEEAKYAQRNAAGAASALAAAPDSPEVRVAREEVARTEAGLAAAVGKLPDAERAEVNAMIAGALLAKSNEVAALRAALAKKDLDFAVVVADRDTLQKQIPPLAASMQTAKAETALEVAKRATIESKVVDYADKVAAEKAEAGSAKGYAAQIEHLALWVAGIYFLGHFLLPLLAQSYPGVSHLTTAANFFKNLTTAHQ